jgi:glucose/arabinose dehydrogenase
MVRRSLALSLTAAFSLAACGGSGADTSGATPTRTATEPGSAGGGSPAPRARPARTGVKLVRIGRFDQPLYVTAPPGDKRRLFVVEQTGQIRVVKRGKVKSRPFLDLSGAVTCCGEQGLLSMAFAPDYASSKRFYVDYTNRQGDTRVVEYRAASADRADPSSARVVLRVSQPEANHNGGLVVFGPDKLLYVGLGDGGGADDRHGARGNAQNRGVLLGKILRIDPRAKGGSAYSVPSSNPFVGRSGVRPEIWAYGLRNPWRFSFDRSKDDLVIGDVGQESREEIDFAPRSKGGGRGVNYGWRPREGKIQNPAWPNERAPGAVGPVLNYSHSGGRCSITGGYVVRDRRVPALYGRYVYGDYCGGRLMSVRLKPGRARSNRSLGLTVSSLSSFGEDASGRVYATSSEGSVYRLAAK